MGTLVPFEEILLHNETVRGTVYYVILADSIWTYLLADDPRSFPLLLEMFNSLFPGQYYYSLYTAGFLPQIFG